MCGDNLRHGLAEGEALQFQALKRLAAKGVEVRRWPRPVLESLEGAWAKVAAERSKADKDFARAWKSLRAFRADYAIWRDLARP